MREEVRISWLIDDCGDEFDPDEILGRFEISSSNGMIFDEFTDLDAWFSALVRGVSQIENNQFVELDLVVEPNPIFISRVGDKLEINYGGNSLSGIPLSEFKRAISESIARILNEIRRRGFDPRKSIWLPLDNWIRKFDSD